jgi:hypothetical protein
MRQNRAAFVSINFNALNGNSILKKIHQIEALGTKGVAYNML